MLFYLSTPDEIAQEIGDRIRANRLAQNLSQSELAARAGISERALRNFERSGKGTFDLFLRTTSALGLTGALSELFVLKPKSIEDMERASQKRQRASRRRTE